MKRVPEHTYVREALEAAETVALSLTRVELCNFLVEVRRVLGADGPERFMRAYFELEGGSLSDQKSDQVGDAAALQYMPLINAISEASLRNLPVYDGWKWWELYVRWNLFVGINRLSEEERTRYRGIIDNRKVLEDARVKDSDILVGAYRFQVDFDPDEEWIDEKAVSLLCDVSTKTVAELCARTDVETCKSDYASTVIRVGAVREYLSTSPSFVPTTFLDPDDDRIKAARGET